MRHIVIDTETTGFDPALGHRMVEIGCVELVNHVPSGRVFHHYLNPQRSMPEGAQKVHGLTDAFLKDKPLFAEVADDFLAFIAADDLVIHNASFDMSFINAELKLTGFDPLPMERAFDTLALARKKFPGAPASLDALCKRFNISNAARNFHGALLDARLLADVYLELIGGRQPDLTSGFGSFDRGKNAAGHGAANQSTKQIRTARVFAIPAAEIEAHEAAIAKIAGNSW